MAIPRTKSLSTKVTATEYAEVEALAGHQTVSEWARAVILRAALPDPTQLAILAEFVALRMILLNLHFSIANGETLTADQMHMLIDRAEQEKWKKAKERLDAAKSIRVQ